MTVDPKERTNVQLWAIIRGLPGADDVRPEIEELAHRAETAVQLKQDVERMARENARLRGVIQQHDLCHDLHGKVDARGFANGCNAEQRRIYGCAPDADALAVAIALLRARVHGPETAWNAWMFEIDAFLATRDKPPTKTRDTMPRRHELKCWPEFFDVAESWSKPFEVRYDDRGYAVGDVIVLCKWSPHHKNYLDKDNTPCSFDACAKIERRITYKMPGGRFGIDQAWCVLGFGMVPGGALWH